MSLMPICDVRSLCELLALYGLFFVKLTRLRFAEVISEVLYTAFGRNRRSSSKWSNVRYNLLYRTYLYSAYTNVFSFVFNVLFIMIIAGSVILRNSLLTSSLYLVRLYSAIKHLCIVGIVSQSSENLQLLKLYTLNALNILYWI